MTANDVTTVLQDYSGRTAPAEKPTMVLVRGRPVEAKKVKEYLRRTTRDKLAGMEVPWGKTRRKKHAAASSKDPSLHIVPTLQRLASPDSFRFPEEIMLLSGQLVSGSREGGIWTTDPENNLIFSTDTLVQWEHQLSIGRYLFVTKKYKHAFKVIDSAFDMMEQLLTTYEPSLFIYLLINALDFHPTISQRLFSYAADMSKVKLSAQHPLTQIWEKLRQADPDQLRRSAWPILRSYVNVLERLSDTDKNLPFVTYWLLNDTYSLGLVSEVECSARLRSIIKQCEARGQQDHVMQAKVILGNVNMWAGNYSVTRELLKEAIKMNQTSTGEPRDKVVGRQTYHQEFHLCTIDGTPEQTIKAAQKYLRYLLNWRGPGHPDLVLLASRFQVYLEKHGISTESVGLDEYLNPDWDIFCAKIMMH